MSVLVGLVITLGALLGGFAAMGGNIAVIWQPWEFVIIGGTALELGDRFNLPTGQIVSGPLLQALAAESILQGRTLRPTSEAVRLGGPVFIVLLMAAFWRRSSAIARAAVLVGSAIAAEAGAMLLQTKLAIVADTSLFHLAAAFYLIAIALDEINFRGLVGRIAERRFLRIAMSLGDGLVSRPCSRRTR